MSDNPFARQKIEAAVQAFMNADDVESLVKAAIDNPIMLTEPFFKAVEMSMDQHPEIRQGLSQRLATLKVMAAKIREKMAEDERKSGGDIKSSLGGFGSSGGSSYKSSSSSYKSGSSFSSSSSSKSGGDSNNAVWIGAAVVVIIIILVLVL